MEPEKLAQSYEKRDAALMTEFNRVKPIYIDVRDFLAPRTARFDGEQVHSGQRQDTNIINTKPRFAVRTLPSGMQSGVTSPMRPWFRLGLPDPDLEQFAPVKRWLFIIEQRMREVMGRSNLYDRLKSNYGILGNYGTSALILDEDEEDVIRGIDLLMGSFRVATDANGRVNTLYRTITLTATQVMERGQKRGWIVPPIIKQQYDLGNYEARFTFCQVLEENRNFRPGSALKQYKRFASVWIHKESAGPSIVHVGGYTDKPFMCPRWDVIGEDAYGIGCGELALGDAKQLQLMEKRKLQGIDKNVNPPMIADASMRNQRVSILPGDTTYVNGLINGRPGYQPAYQVNPYLRDLKEEIAVVAERIDEAYFKNLFLMVAEIADQPNITATQINAMREEKLLMLGPVLERLNDELLDPVIDRVFSIMESRGMVPPPPKNIQGMPLKVEYISVLAQAQKAIGIGNIERFVNFTASLAGATQNPAPLDRLNMDEIIEEYADGVAVPPHLLNTPEEAEARRQDREQQAQQAQALQSGVAAADVAKTMSETDMNKDSALLRALNMASGQVPLNVAG